MQKLLQKNKDVFRLAIIALYIILKTDLLYKSVIKIKKLNKLKKKASNSFKLGCKI